MGKNSLLKLGFFLVGGIASTSVSPASELVEINRVVARVNDRIVTWGEIERAMDRMNFTDEEKKRRSADFVDGKIDRLLSINAFSEQGMAMPESYVEQEYNKKLMQEFNGDRKLFRDVLKGNGQSLLEYRDNLKEDIIHMHMLSARKRKREEVSPGRVEEYYRENMGDFRTETSVRLREIVITQQNGETDHHLSKKASSIWESLKKGASFKELAEQHGDSPFKSDGGDWGVYATKKEIRNDQIRKYAFLLKKGEFSSPFKVELLERKPDGSIGKSGEIAYYILQAADIRPGGVKDINKVRPEIEKILASEIESKSQRQWLSRQKKGAYVNVTLPE